MSAAIEIQFGHIELRQVCSVIGSRLHLGGYAIRRYGGGGRDISPVTWNGWIECHTAKEAEMAAKCLPGYERVPFSAD